MPIYEYECQKCGKVTEALQKFSDPPLSECPHCHGALHKLVSLGAFHLKGSGWYATDYAGKPAANRPANENKGGDQTEKADKKEDASNKSSSEG